MKPANFKVTLGSGVKHLELKEYTNKNVIPLGLQSYSKDNSEELSDVRCPQGI